MGAWSVSITGNDTASDLRDEYTAAFYRCPPDEAVQLLDKYVREQMFGESDEEEWCNYVYSLADFMWKKGILTDEVRKRALKMIEGGYGLDAWAEAGEKTLAAREAVLQRLKTQLLSPLPPKKKISPSVNTEPIFEDGDIIAFRLQTTSKPYAKSARNRRPMTDDEFHALDGKYVIVQKILCYSSWSSAVVPDVKCYWAFFRLFDGVYDEAPTSIDISALRDARFRRGQRENPVFCCESKLFYFKRRKYAVLGNDKSELPRYQAMTDDCESVYFSVNHEFENFDSQLLSAMNNDK